MKPKAYLKSLEILRDATQTNLDANQMRCLFYLFDAGKQGLSLGEIGEELGVSHVAAARIARKFTAEGSESVKMQGWDLAEIYYEPSRPRANLVRLLPKGNELVEKFLNSLDKAAEGPTIP